MQQPDESRAAPRRTAGARRLAGPTVLMFGVLAAANLAVWGWALLAFRDLPVLLGTAALAYSLGLRHAFDADHIAAIDNVTRKLMQDGQRPIGAGLFFALGHSTVVILASVGVAIAALSFEQPSGSWQDGWAMAGTIVSSLFLLVIAAANLVILSGIRRGFTRLRAGERLPPAQLELLLDGGGPLVRLIRPMFRLIGRSWHMYPLGLLFGLGFDTATEVALLGIAAAAAAHGLPMSSLLVFPALFTAGMTLLDSADSALMVGAYGWAFARPIRKLYYNMTITFVSAMVALLVGGIEMLGLLAEHLQLAGPGWDLVAALNDNMAGIGAAIVVLFIASWGVSVAIYRARGYDRLDDAGG